MSANGLKRPETEYSRHRKQYDTNSRYKYDNVLTMELDMPEKTTQDYEGPDMMSRVAPVLNMSLMDDNDEEVQFSAVENSLGNPYLHYNPEDAGRDTGRENDGGDGNRKKKERRGSRKDRPSTAGRRKIKREAGNAEAKEEYPSSGGRVEYK